VPPQLVPGHAPLLERAQQALVLLRVRESEVERFAGLHLALALALALVLAPPLALALTCEYGRARLSPSMVMCVGSSLIWSDGRCGAVRAAAAAAFALVSRSRLKIVVRCSSIRFTVCASRRSASLSGSDSMPATAPGAAAGAAAAAAMGAVTRTLPISATRCRFLGSILRRALRGSSLCASDHRAEWRVLRADFRCPHKAAKDPRVL